jgi:hypothetical protein
MTAKSARVGAMRPPHRHRREVTCGVMPRHLDFLSVGAEFGADDLGEHIAWWKSADIARGARSVTVQFLTGRNCHQYREASGAMVRASSVY